MGHVAAVRVHAAKFAFEQVDGVVVQVADFEDVVAALVFRHQGLAGQLVPGFLAQGLQRKEAGEFGSGDVHGAGSGSNCTRVYRRAGRKR